MKGDKKIRKRLQKLDDAVAAMFNVRGVDYESDDIDRNEFVEKLHEIQARLDRLFDVCEPQDNPGW